MEKQLKKKSLGQVAVGSMASIARGIARDNVGRACWGLVYQPKEPKDLANRLAAMKK